MPLHLNTPLPSLAGGTEWLNGGPLQSEELVGHPALIHFWSISCHLCKETMPAVNAWRDRYGPAGLQVVAVHMPRGPEDTDVEKVKELVEKLGITQPVVVDNTHAIKKAFSNEYVPAFYVFDSEGKLRHFQAGDRGLKIVERRIRRVLGLPEEDGSSAG